MGEGIEQLLEIMARLRAPDGGCPWDREQTFASIVPHTIEEAYEVAEAVEGGDSEELKDELGDLLFQVVFLSQLAQEARLFSFDDVVDTIVKKLVRRHPHVFGDVRAASEEEVAHHWERIKREERRQKSGDTSESLMDGITVALPAMTRALKLQKRAAKVGFDWSCVDAVFNKMDEEIGELKNELADSSDRNKIEHEVGDVLLVCTNLARHLKVEPESALRAANRRFELRFRRMERSLEKSGKKMTGSNIDELQVLWERAKRDEASGFTECDP